MAPLKGLVIFFGLTFFYPFVVPELIIIQSCVMPNLKGLFSLHQIFNPSVVPAIMTFQQTVFSLNRD